MNNVISFKDASDRRKKKNEKKIERINAIEKKKTPSSSEISFIDEVKRFKFRLSDDQSKISFVIMNTKNLPEPFPPNPLPPMVA